MFCICVVAERSETQKQREIETGNHRKRDKWKKKRGKIMLPLQPGPSSRQRFAGNGPRAVAHADETAVSPKVRLKSTSLTRTRPIDFR